MLNFLALCFANLQEKGMNKGLKVVVFGFYKVFSIYNVYSTFVLFSSVYAKKQQKKGSRFSYALNGFLKNML